MSLLKEEAYHQWQAVEKETQAERITWEYFLKAFQNKYVATTYVEAHWLEFLELKQGRKPMVEYEAEFLRLNRYAQEMITSEQLKGMI